MSISWDLIETFLAVMRSGSLSAASRELAVAQPTIRRRVEALEASLGVVLFTRGPNGLVPTHAADAMQPTAEAMESTARAFERGVGAGDKTVRGTVRVAASQVVGVEVLPTLLRSLITDGQRGLEIEIVTSNRLADLLRRDADVAVRMTTPMQSSLVAKRAGTIPVGLFATRELLRGRPGPRRLSDLGAWPLVGPDQDRAAWRALVAAGFDVPRKQFVLRSDDDLVQLAAVRAGVGIGVCQLPLAARDPTLERVVPGFEFPLETFIVTHEDQRRVPKIRAVFDHLVTELSAYGSPKSSGRTR